MKKQIAVLMYAVALDSQKKLFEGMLKATKEIDCNLYFFTNYVNLTEKDEHIDSSYCIFKLPDFKEFDGVIVAKNLIKHEKTADYITKALEESNIPVVSIDFELPNASYVGVSTYEAQMKIIEHLILEHNCNDICYAPRCFP